MKPSDMMLFLIVIPKHHHHPKPIRLDGIVPAKAINCNYLCLPWFVCRCSRYSPSSWESNSTWWGSNLVASYCYYQEELYQSDDSIDGCIIGFGFPQMMIRYMGDDNLSPLSYKPADVKLWHWLLYFLPHLKFSNSKLIDHIFTWTMTT